MSTNDPGSILKKIIDLRLRSEASGLEDLEEIAEQIPPLNRIQKIKDESTRDLLYSEWNCLNAYVQERMIDKTKEKLPALEDIKNIADPAQKEYVLKAYADIIAYEIERMEE